MQKVEKILAILLLALIAAETLFVSDDARYIGQILMLIWSTSLWEKSK